MGDGHLSWVRLPGIPLPRRDHLSLCVWLYFRFCLSFRDVQEMMLERGVVVSHEAIRLWCATAGTRCAASRAFGMLTLAVSPASKPGLCLHSERSKSPERG